jgi:hypothetical protein
MNVAIGKSGIATSRLQCWLRRCWRSGAQGDKKTPAGQAPVNVPELRRLLAHFLWRGWHGVEHLLR